LTYATSVQFRIVWAALAVLIAIIAAALVFNGVYSDSDSEMPPIPADLDVSEILSTLVPSLEMEIEPSTSRASSSVETQTTSVDNDPLRLFEEL
jgi:hypothetical protein